MATGNGADVCHTTCSKSEKGRSWDFKFGITIIDCSVLSHKGGYIEDLLTLH